MILEIVVGAVFAAVCAGFAVYFGIAGDFLMCAAFAVCAVLSFVPAVRKFYKKRKEDKKEDNSGTDGGVK